MSKKTHHEEHHEDRHEEKVLEEILRSQRETLQRIGKVEHTLHRIEREIKPPQPSTLTAAIAVQFSGDIPMNNALVLNVGQTSQASIAALLADGVTPSGGVVSALPGDVVFTFNDPSATVVLNADGVTATVTGIAPSAGPISGSVACSVTDTDGAVSAWTQAFTIQTNGSTPPPPAQLTQSIAVQFSTPTP